MTVIVAGVIIGLLLGRVRGGRLRSFVDLRLRWWSGAAMAVLVLGMHQVGLIDSGSAIAVGALVALAAAAVANLHLAGLGVVAVGLCLNAVPLALNGGTPVEPRALEAIGVEADHIERHLLESQVVVDDSTAAAVLGSTIPLPVVQRVVSFGDLIIAFGLAAGIANAMRRPRRRGIPVSEILASGPLTLGDDIIDLTDAATRPPPAPSPHPERVSRGHERAVEVSVGAPVPVPVGWELPESAIATPASASLRPRLSARHPTMRLLHR